MTDVGDLHTWGSTAHKGVLSPGESSYEPLPKRVPGLKRAVKVSAGEDHTLVITRTSLPELPLSRLHSLKPLSTAAPATELSLEQNRGHGGVEGDDDDEEEEMGEESSSHGGGGDQFAQRDLENGNEFEEVGSLSAEEEAADEVSQRHDELEEASARAPSTLHSGLGVPTLKDFCQRALASSVELKTAVAGLLAAQSFDAPLLRDYCMEFLQL